MHNFEFFNPTKIIFGENRIESVCQYIKNYTSTNNILLVISESCKNNGVLKTVTNQLEKNSIQYYIVDDIIPNPTLDKVYYGKKIIQNNNIDFILAIGGASVIDTAKTIAVASCHNEDIWDLICNPTNIKKSLPLGVVITLYGSGTEMTNGAVISNMMITKKRGFDNVNMFPKFSILDPTTLKSCSHEYLSIGCMDMFTHIMEDYFEITDEENLADSFQELLVKKMIIEFKKLNNNKQDNAKLLWMSTLAQNKFLSFGKKYNGEWVAHIIGHEFCVRYNLPHGQVVAILFIAWLNFIKKINEKRIIQFGVSVFDLKSPTSTEVIDEIKKVYALLNNTFTLKDLGVRLEDIDDIVTNAMNGKKLGKFKELNKEDVKNIIMEAYNGN